MKGWFHNHPFAAWGAALGFVLVMVGMGFRCYHDWELTRDTLPSPYRDTPSASVAEDLAFMWWNIGLLGAAAGGLLGWLVGKLFGR